MLPGLFSFLALRLLRPNGGGDKNTCRCSKHTPNLEQSEMFENNELLDSLWFRMGVHTVAFWGWVVGCVVLLYVR